MKWIEFGNPTSRLYAALPGSTQELIAMIVSNKYEPDFVALAADYAFR